jgi:hypothetical protein
VAESSINITRFMAKQDTTKALKKQRHLPGKTKTNSIKMEGVYYQEVNPKKSNRYK